MCILLIHVLFCFCLSDRLREDDLADVQRKLLAATTKWYNLGLELGQRASTLDCIDVKYRSDPSTCFRQVLKLWLNGVDPSPTWQAMVKALNSSTVAKYQLAKEIEADLPTATAVQPVSPQPQSPPSISPQLLSPGLYYHC